MAAFTGCAVEFAQSSLEPAEIGEVVAALESGWLSTGPRVQRFEREFAAYVGARHAVAVNSCTAALHLSLVVSGIGPGDEVVTTPLAPCATANMVVHVGATPRFADVDPVTWNLSSPAAALAATARTKAFVPVHYGGRPVDVRAFRALASAQGAVLIEDAAHCVEGWAAGLKIGSTADLTCFSFHATRNLTTGEGGMLTTNDEQWATDARIASRHGVSQPAWDRAEGAGAPPDDVVMPGFKYNMPDLQAAIGLHQLARLEDRWHRRVEIAARYDEAFRDLPLTRPPAAPERDRHARHLYTVLVEPSTGWTRDDLVAALGEDGIATRVPPRPVHLHSYYAHRFGLRRGMFPIAERVAEGALSIPLSAAMSDQDVATVIGAVRRRVTGGSPRR